MAAVGGTGMVACAGLYGHPAVGSTATAGSSGVRRRRRQVLRLDRGMMGALGKSLARVATKGLVGRSSVSGRFSLMSCLLRVVWRIERGLGLRRSLCCPSDELS